MLRLTLLVAASLVLALPFVPTAAAIGNPLCEHTSSLCTVYEQVVRTVDHVCDAAITGGCPIGST